MRGILNKDLATLSKRMKLSVPLKLKTARDSYATCLKRGGRSIEEISEMLGHANPQTSAHYLVSLDIEKTHKINEILF
jgi:integrase